MDPVCTYGFLERTAHRLEAAINAEDGIVYWKDCLSILEDLGEFLRGYDRGAPPVPAPEDAIDRILRLGAPGPALAKMLFLLLNTPDGYCSKDDLARFADCSIGSVAVYLTRLRTFLAGLGLEGELKPLYKTGYRLSVLARYRVLELLGRLGPADALAEPLEEDSRVDA